MPHKKYIKRCLQLAKKGIGRTRPNPSVGAVVVFEDKIIGEGFTSPYGGPHAEVNAINSVTDPSLLKKATIYVTLEPCSHHGKTPPCADLIIDKQIPKVVVGCIDTNSLVAGKGIKRLRDAGCEVLLGVLEKECLQHHKRFFTYQNKNRPYVVLKWAETKDGFIAPFGRDEQKPVWITNSFSKQLVHKWRAQEHAILVGTNTVLEDNPSLNLRYWSGFDPVRVILDRSLKIKANFEIYNGEGKVIVLTDTNTIIPLNKDAVIFEKIDFSQNIASQICKVLHHHKIQSLFVEGGTRMLQTFITANIWDEAKIFIGDTFFNEGIKSPAFNATLSQVEKIDNDILRTFYND